MCTLGFGGSPVRHGGAWGGAASVGLCRSVLGVRLCLSVGFLAFRSAKAYGGQWVCCLSVLLSSYCLDQCGGDANCAASLQDKGKECRHKDLHI